MSNLAPVEGRTAPRPCPALNRLCDSVVPRDLSTLAANVLDPDDPSIKNKSWKAVEKATALRSFRQICRRCDNGMPTSPP